MFFRILLFIVGFWFVQRFLGLLLGGARRQSRPPEPPSSRGEESNRMVKDPVCGMYLDSRLAIQASGKEGILYFCSRECRDKFKSQPVG
jgi:uncharacterized protein